MVTSSLEEAIDRSVRHQVAIELADLMDTHADGDGQWEAADICDALSGWIAEHEGWQTCPHHGVFSAGTSTCPFGRED